MFECLKSELIVSPNHCSWAVIRVVQTFGRRILVSMEFDGQDHASRSLSQDVRSSARKFSRQVY